MARSLPDIEPLTSDAVAAAVVDLLPEADREEARALVASIIAVRLAGLATHPRPRRLAELVFERLATEVEDAGAGEATDRLRDQALLAEIEGLTQDSLALAAARFGADHEQAQSLSRAWSEYHPDWSARDTDFYVTESGRLRATLTSVRDRLRDVAPEALGTTLPDLLRVEMTLNSAETGVFATAAGSLADFLRDAGAEFDELEFD